MFGPKGRKKSIEMRSLLHCPVQWRLNRQTVYRAVDTTLKAKSAITKLDNPGRGALLGEMLVEVSKLSTTAWAMPWQA